MKDRKYQGVRSPLHDATVVVNGGPAPAQQSGLLNPPVHRASTIVYESVATYKRRHEGYYDEVIYGLYGTETVYALAAAITELERASDTLIAGSGTAAIAIAISSFVQAGDHVLVADSVYGSTRKFCDEVLGRFGVDVSYFDPTIGVELDGKVRPNTRMVYLEAPGSLTFEMTDVPTAVAVARRHDLVTAMDNTWATPRLFKPLEHGVDLSIQSATKYLSGHSDVMVGTVSTRSRAHYKRIKDAAGRWGCRASPDDCYLVHRGLRTLDVRLERHERNARKLISWLQQRPEVRRILFPGIEEDPGYPIWSRDFAGASGLFGVLLDPMTDRQETAFFDALQLFKIGSSWGGYESLIVPAWPLPVRQACAAPEDGYLARIHAGLENAEDLVADLSNAFAKLSLADGTV